MNKLLGKVGPLLSSNKLFVERIKSLVWADHISIEEFEEGWNMIMEEFGLDDNSWLRDMFNMRSEWIPAYFNAQKMAGLLRTTSRSESSNFYFQHFQQSGDTLVEFFSRFESAIDKQRFINRQNNADSEFMPRLDTPMRIERDAARLYTRNLFYLVREEIKSVSYYTSITEITHGDGVSIFKIKDSLLKDKIFEVTVNLSDHQVNCSCNFYIRRGYLCKHAFSGLHQCGVTSIPRAHLNLRWTKNIERRYSEIAPENISEQCSSLERINLKLNEVWFDFQTCLSYVGYEEANVDKMKISVKALKDEFRESTTNKGINIRQDAIDKIIGTQSRSNVTVKNPNTSRNKGCGSRIKSGKENSVAAGKHRTCSICKQAVGHNARSCPSNKS